MRTMATTSPEATLVLARSDVRRVLSLADCVDAVERAFRRQGQGLDPAPRVLGLHVGDGGFHAKAAVVGEYFAMKLNANFPLNRRRARLPTIQGVVVLARVHDGRMLAIMDSMEITTLRTAAATVLAARVLASASAEVATLCGCGAQGMVHLEAIVTSSKIRRVFLHDAVRDAAEQLARDFGRPSGVAIEPTDDLAAAVRQSDVVVTCTPARRPLIHAADVRSGTFIAAVGADSEEKQELDPAILARATVVVDSLEQCATFGELHHALDAGLLGRDAVHAELGQILAGQRPGRRSADEITVFDSTGTALQDVAAAALVYERAREAGLGRGLELGG
jgi:alanine dehydrogenase